MKYLNSSQTDRETIARNILAQDGVRGGLVCVAQLSRTLLDSKCFPFAKIFSWRLCGHGC